jgi:hypothetical protein
MPAAACGSLEIRFNAEDTDGNSTCVSSTRGPAWRANRNDGCPYDEAGLAWGGSSQSAWKDDMFYAGNKPTYRLWLVR